MLALIALLKKKRLKNLFSQEQLGLTKQIMGISWPVPEAPECGELPGYVVKVHFELVQGM